MLVNPLYVPDAASLRGTSAAVASGGSSCGVTVDRANGAMASAGLTSALTSGTCYVARIAIARPCKPATAYFVTGTTAATNPTNRWIALTNSAGLVLAVTADATSTAIGASAQFAMNFVTPVSIQPGLYAVHFLVVAGVVPTVLGLAQTAVITAKGTILCGLGSTAQTTPPAVGATLDMPTSAGVGPAFFELA